jgi:hypothetical protein
MSTATTTTTTTEAAKAANKAGRAIIDSVASAGDSLTPTVVETAEVALSVDVPTKLVVNQGVVVAAAFVGGVAVTAGAFFGWKKYQEYKNNKAIEKAAEELNKATETK